MTGAFPNRLGVTVAWLSILCACFAALLPMHGPLQGAPPGQTQADNCGGVDATVVAAAHAAKRVTATPQTDDGVLRHHPLLATTARGFLLPVSVLNTVNPRRSINTARGPPTVHVGLPPIQTT